jgi:hypothetical protein
MSLYSQDEKEKHMQMVGQVLLLDPYASLTQIQKRVEKADEIRLSTDYLQDLRKELLSKQSARIREQTKELVAIEVENMAMWCITQLRRVHQEEIVVFGEKDGKQYERKYVSQANRIKALSEIFKIFDRMVQLKMDLGILERKLGTLGVESELEEAMNLVKLYRDTGGDAKKITIRDAEAVEQSTEALDSGGINQ